ncbi:MAG TPA: hypothetical protein VL049_27870, partial [Candidatus Dormibacteraeota bacterium]|nr:hypothetical protein [Candidatus Dormibacteraeota bacterium]
MPPHSSLAALARSSASLALFLVVGGSAGSARAFSGAIDYTGDLGPINARRPLCLCVYTMPDLSNRLGCLIYEHNDVSYGLNNLADKNYYLVAFVDVHINERLDKDEPFQIYQGRGSTPGDPLNGKSTASDIDFVFGDENVPATPTPTETRTSSPTATPSP